MDASKKKKKYNKKLKKKKKQPINKPSRPLSLSLYQQGIIKE